MTLEEVRARVERIVREILEEREASSDPSMEPVPAKRARAAERRRVLGDYQAGIGSGHSIVLKVGARVEVCRGRRVQSVSSIDVMRRRAETERTHGGSEAWNLAADWLSGKVGGSEVPGGVIAMCTELGVGRLQPLPNIDAELEKLEADLAQHVARLVADLDAWDRQRTVTADVTLDLPAMQMHATGSVK